MDEGVAAVTGQRGTTLPEVLVGALLMAVLVLAGAELIEHSARMVARVGREARGSSAELVRAQLRRDIQEAPTVLTPSISWSPTPLALRRRDGDVVVLEVADEILRRRVQQPDGTVLSERLLARGVTGWWWRHDAARVVDLRLTLLVNDRAGGAIGEVPPWRRTELMRFALRTPFGGVGW